MIATKKTGALGLSPARIQQSTDSLRAGLVGYNTRFYLPVEISKKVGPIEVNPEVGYIFASHSGAAWFNGLVVLREVNKRMELAGEFYNSANTDGTNHWNTFDAGGRYILGEHYILLFMAGRSLTGASPSQPSFFGYLGMQFLFSMKHKKDILPKLAATSVKQRCMPHLTLQSGL